MAPVRHDKFHGRHQTAGRGCDSQGCDEAGEFRAPGLRGSGFARSGTEGPGDYRWFCLEHIRAFNAGYDFFAGMSQDEIFEAQSPLHGWAQETRAFRANGGIDQPPRWADFTDPLEAISARARKRQAAGWPDGKPVLPDERRSLDALALSPSASRHDLRSRYSELVRRYHPDRNGGDRSNEARLQQVVEAYQLLRKLPAFA